MDPPNWNNLNNRQKLRILSSDVQQLISELISLTSPGGELDTVLDKSIASFEPVLQSFNIEGEYGNIDVDDSDISLETILKDVASDRAKRDNEKRARRKSGKDDNTQSETSELTDVWGRREFLNKVDTTEIPHTSGMSATFAEPSPSRRKTRSSKTKENTESSYETLTHYEPLRVRRLRSESDGRQHKSGESPSSIY